MDFYLIVDALRLNRTDNALIRMNTEVPGRRKIIADAERRLVGFAGVVNPLLSQYIPTELPAQTTYLFNLLFPNLSFPRSAHGCPTSRLFCEKSEIQTTKLNGHSVFQV